ncbi:esterase E4-like isoform X2 [Bacillus rossius redtenbacheri]|uniref:esterase E4-like isoform X2 n=2 Tax=Bacillus rossius redtenbacheri TaxID=93214 RepID=UPI002FDE4001
MLCVQNVSESTTNDVGGLLECAPLHGAGPGVSEPRAGRTTGKAGRGESREAVPGAVTSPRAYRPRTTTGRAVVDPAPGGMLSAGVLLLWLGGVVSQTVPELCFIATLSNVQDNTTAPAAQRDRGDDCPVVSVAQGYLRGRKVTSEQTGGVFYSFQGVPYARPPVGDLRFQAPREAQSWRGVRDATVEGSICPQYDNGPIRGSEDCLFINVYTPKLPRARRAGLLPVMVWVHGGGHTYGSGNSINYGPDFLVRKNVVLVTLNYRLGVLGFLGVTSSLVSKNNGFKDQVAALKWVQTNIAQFGGDKARVTIFGQSSGAASVDYLMLSPAAKGLFHGVIAHSGNAIDRWTYAEPNLSRERALLLGRVLGLTTNDEDELARFLKAASVEQLVSSQLGALTEEDLLRSVDIPFQPTKEEPSAHSRDIFLPDSPINILKSGRYQHVPYITGFTSAETKMSYTALISNESLWEELSRKMEQFVPPDLGLPLGSSKSLELAAEIKNMYFGEGALTTNNIQDLVTLATDEWFILGARRSARHLLRTSSAPVYVYQFSYVGDISLSQFCDYGYPFRGAAHTDDLGHLFWIKRINSKPSSKDEAIRNLMTTMWTNFAKTGNPTEGLNVSWNPFNLNSQTYLDIDTELSTRDLRKLRPKKSVFWDKLYADIDNNTKISKV